MTPLSKQQRELIQERLQLFHDNVDAKRDALIEGKPYSQDMAMTMNEVTMITKSIPALLASDAEREAEVERLRDALHGIEAAWMVEGKFPAYHVGWQQTLAKEWPTMHKAILNASNVLHPST